MDTVFFVASKIVGLLLRPDIWILGLAGFVFASLLLKRLRAASWASGVLVCFLVLLGLFPLGDIVVAKMERSFPANPEVEEIHGIVVLGGSEDAAASAHWGQVQLNASAERYTEALALAKQHPTSQLVFAGGSGKLRDLLGAEVSEATIAETFFLRQGLEKERLLMEGRSRNTVENARFSYALAAPEADETWVLVTTAYHMPRALRSFETVGWDGVIPWPVDYRTAVFSDRIGWNLTRNLRILNIALREVVGQIAYRITAR